jgi:hypothetical protein
VEPAQIIASHIPFDYLWQFLIILLLMGETQVNKLRNTLTSRKKFQIQWIVRDRPAFEAAARIEKMV